MLSCALLSTPRAEAAAPYGQGLRLNLSEDGEFYVKFLTWHQVWSRYMELNPGTEIQGEAAGTNFDIALRRSRFLVMAALGERVLVLTHFGVDNQVFNGARKPQLFMHDAWVQYEVLPRHLSVGFGLHYWHGVSRMTNASTLNLVPLDAPVLNWPTIERTDQFARFLGVFAKGKLGGFDYRVALNKPFAAETSTKAMASHPDVADYDPTARTVNVEGYLQYQAWDEESATLPYAVGTYLGQKRVLNFGAGFHFQPAGMVSYDAAGQERSHDLALLGLDVFLDTPVGEYGALTGYLVYYHYDFGPNHLRSIGIMNPGSGGTSVNGAGNAFPVIGTSTSTGSWATSSPPAGPSGSPSSPTSPARSRSSRPWSSPPRWARRGSTSCWSPTTPSSPPTIATGPSSSGETTAPGSATAPTSSSCRRWSSSSRPSEK